jgi:hypothetical protein
MIRWLEEHQMDDVVRSNFERFRRTSFAKDLEEEKGAWQMMSWPRSSETPLRFLLKGSQNQRATFTIDGDGREYGSIDAS